MKTPVLGGARFALAMNGQAATVALDGNVRRRDAWNLHAHHATVLTIEDVHRGKYASAGQPGIPARRVLKNAFQFSLQRQQATHGIKRVRKTKKSHAGPPSVSNVRLCASRRWVQCLRALVSISKLRPDRALSRRPPREPHR